VLMPLRAFGDVRFKWSLELQQSILARLESGVDLDALNLYQYTPPNYLTPPYLEVTPEITYHKLRPQDRFLILATDGLWDEFATLDTNTATHLIRHALGSGEYGELSQERLASMLALPEDLARMYRDDITVTVVYLNYDLARPHHS
ncbi:hypothetical protein GOODEAATRI_028204, partial [Goodea atripinnis]